MSKNSGNPYLKPDNKEMLIMILKSAGAVILLDHFFYRSLWVLVILIPLGIAFLLLQIKLMADKKRAEFRQQFKELLMLSSTLQRAGYSVENSILKSHKDIRYMFGRASPICRLLREISSAAANRGSAGEVFVRVGRQCGMEEIEDFGSVYEIAYQKSGNMSEIMDKAAESIIERTEVENEIYVSISKSRFEMKIMNMMPFFIMAYISLTGRGYFDVMYHNLPGIVVMSACMIVYIFAYVWGVRIVSVKA